MASRPLLVLLVSCRKPSRLLGGVEALRPRFLFVPANYVDRPARC
jgi:hypothetical protein